MEDKLPRRRLGSTGLDIFPVCLGCNPLGWTADESRSFEILDAFHAAGGNLLDTADEYSDWAPGNGGGVSERIIGKWMRARGNRDRIIVATKVGLYRPLRGLAARTIQSAIEGSLKRLGTEYVDLYYAHADDPIVPQEETLAAFDALVRDGKVRYLGASNISAGRLLNALIVSERGGWSQYAVVQPHYNLIDRDAYEAKLMPVCEARGLAVLPFQGLAMGFLSGKYRADGPIVESARMPRVRDLYMNQRGYAALEAVTAVAAEIAAPVAAVALAWLLAQRSVVAPIVGASHPDQVADLMRAAYIALTPDQLSSLRVC
ncbi:MAG: aldo/keto reductase [Candidatus Dormibacteraeota bacterium]|nr:aldo/keto reductase [Candidatus Dormibacteraeota bacterium]